MEEYPLYPELTEAGKQEAQRLIERFKKTAEEILKPMIDNFITDVYCDVAIHIESDSWINFRNTIMDGYKNYSNKSIQAEYDFKEIRKQIYKDYKDEIDKDLNQDSLEKITILEKEISYLKEEINRKKYM